MHTVKEMVSIAHDFAKKNRLEIPYQLLWLNAEGVFRQGSSAKPYC